MYAGHWQLQRDSIEIGGFIGSGEFGGILRTHPFVLLALHAPTSPTQLIVTLYAWLHAWIHLKGTFAGVS